MCLINFQLQNHPRYKLVLAANRDEFYRRPTEAAHFWKDEPNLLAGRDLMQMGTWLGATKTGRIAALTNFRDPSIPETQKISRGVLVRNYLASSMEPRLFLESLIAEDYSGFNILAGTADHLFYYNNIEGQVVEVSPGIHGLSNHFLDTPWPKVIKGKNYLERYLSEHNDASVDDLFEILSDAEPAPDIDLPETGVGLDFERRLSSMFIKMPDYGTRCASVILVDHNNHLTFAERIYENGDFKDQQVFKYAID